MVFWGLGLLVWVGLGSGQWLLSATGVGAAVGDECSGGFCFSVVTKTLSYSCCIVWIVFFYFRFVIRQVYFSFVFDRVRFSARKKPPDWFVCSFSK